MIEVRCQRAPWSDNIEVLVTDNHGQARFAAAVLSFAPINPNEVLEPTLRLSNAVAQGLMDELWRCGLRPTEGSGSAGSLAATERHLGDMQKIAFRLLNGVAEEVK